MPRKSLPKVLGQERTWTCGPASLRWVLRDFGMRVSEARLAKLCRTTRSSGTSWSGLLEGIEKLGLSARRGEGGTLWNLPEGRTLIGWDDAEPGEPQDDHLSALVGYSHKTVYLMDPHPLRKGTLREMPITEFEHRWYDWDFKEKRLVKRGWVVIDRPYRSS